MSLKEKLEELGWHLSEEGIEIISEKGQIQDVDVLAKRALDYDIRDIGETAFPDEFTKDPSRLEKPIVVQIQKIRNVSAPKANEESTFAQRMLKLTLHDGKSSVIGLEINFISSLSINIPPGTKILLKDEGLEACHGVLRLTPNVVTVLGGKVVLMIEKWELNRSLAKHTRGAISGEGGPPPWIPFGQRLEAQENDKQFKSIQENKQDNAEFEAQRKGAIAEAQRLSGVKKVFGGGSKPLLDANVQKIVDAGFTEEQAENTLKYTKNNVDRALKVLQKRDASESRQKDKTKETEPRGRGRGAGRNRDFQDEDQQVKPSGKVSLFEFLEDKLPNVTDKDAYIRPSMTQTNNDKFERNFNNRDRNGAKNSRQGTRFDSNKKDNYNNHTHNHREERNKYPCEKPPRFQKKFDEQKKMQNHNNYNHVNSYGNYQNQFGRSSTQNHVDKTYMNNVIDNLAEQTASNLNINIMPNLMARANEEQTNYQPSPHDFPRSQFATNMQEITPFRRNNEMTKFQQDSFRRPQPNGYIEPQPNAMYQNMSYVNQQPYGRQYNAISNPMSYSAPRPQEYNQMQSGAPFLSGSILGFQNPSVNEQARAMLGGADIAWQVGDRCLALYWEDNNFYEAEITGMSTNTVVVKFLAYGNHEEVLKENCMQFPGQGGPARYIPQGNDRGVFANRRP